MIIECLKISDEKIDRDFCTLSYIDKAITKLKNEGLL